MTASFDPEDSADVTLQPPETNCRVTVTEDSADCEEELYADHQYSTNQDIVINKTTSQILAEIEEIVSLVDTENSGSVSQDANTTQIQSYDPNLSTIACTFNKLVVNPDKQEIDSNHGFKFQAVVPIFVKVDNSSKCQDYNTQYFGNMSSSTLSWKWGLPSLS